jgi:hypothetical protein
VSEADRKRRPCAACGKPVGTATIVAGGDFPDAPICLACFNGRDPFGDLPESIRRRRATAENPRDPA